MLFYGSPYQLPFILCLYAMPVTRTSTTNQIPATTDIKAYSQMLRISSFMDMSPSFKAVDTCALPHVWCSNVIAVEGESIGVAQSYVKICRLNAADEPWIRKERTSCNNSAILIKIGS